MKNRILLVMIATIVTINIFSQIEPSFIRLPEYSFIKKDSCRLIIPHNSDSTLIDRFFHRLDTLLTERRGKINIVHIGGSHVQCGALTDRIRKNFDSLNIIRSTGFIFPYSIAKTNTPKSYSVSYKGEWSYERCVKRKEEARLGVGGIAVYTKDINSEIEIKINKNYYSNRAAFFNNIKVLGYVKDGEEWAVMPIIKVDSDNSRVILPQYDYVERPYYEFRLMDDNNSFRVSFYQLDTTFHEFVVTGFIIDNNKVGINYNAIGVNGAAVNSYLGCERFQDEIRVIKPDMVIFGIGINDAVPVNFSVENFKLNYNKLIEEIKNISPNCAFIFITNNDSYRRRRGRKYRVNRNGTAVQKAMYELAAQNNGAVFDQFSLMGGLGSMMKWQNQKLAQKDKVHFTQNGYYIIADMFYNAFIKYYKDMKK